MGRIDKYSILEVMTLAAKSLKTIDPDYLLEISHMHYTVDFLDQLGLEEGLYGELLNNIRQKNMTGIEQIAAAAGLDEERASVLRQIPFLYGPMKETIKKQGPWPSTIRCWLIWKSWESIVTLSEAWGIPGTSSSICPWSTISITTTA